MAYNFLDPLPGLNYGVILTADNTLALEFVPVPAAVWLFGSGLSGMAAATKRKAVRLRLMLNEDQTTAFMIGGPWSVRHPTAQLGV